MCGVAGHLSRRLLLPGGPSIIRSSDNMESVSEFVHGLRNLPLVHGFLNWPIGKSQKIRQSGLVAPGPCGAGFNSFDHDEILGRKRFVFLSTAKLHPDYTYRFDTFVLVDPRVALLGGVEFSLVDIAQIVDQIRWTLSHDTRPYPEWVRDPEIFDGIIGHEEQSAREAYAKERGLHEVPMHVPNKYVLRRICASESFRRYLRCYTLRRISSSIRLHGRRQRINGILTLTLSAIGYGRTRRRFSFQMELRPNCSLGFGTAAVGTSGMIRRARKSRKRLEDFWPRSKRRPRKSVGTVKASDSSHRGRFFFSGAETPAGPPKTAQYGLLV
jgi:hypothetical protein